jgi:hypothetical protein
MSTLMNLQKKALQRENHDTITKLSESRGSASSSVTIAPSSGSLSSSQQKKKFVITIPLRTSLAQSGGTNGTGDMSPS